MSPHAPLATSSAFRGGEDTLLAALVHELPDALLVLDANSGLVLGTNGVVRGLLGYEPAWLEGRRLDDLRDPPAEAPLAERARRHGLVVEECEWRRVDGSRTMLHLRTRLADVRGRALVIVALRDGRERRRAEERYRGLFDNAIEGFFQTTPDGRYIAANRTLAAVYGYETPTAMIIALTDIAGQLYVDTTRRQAFRRLLEAQDAVHGFESAVRRRDGRIVWISENARAVRDADGRLLCYEGTVVDITTRKRAEAAEREEAEVAAALARVGEAMIASINPPVILDRLCRLTAEVLDCDWSHALLWEADADVYVPVAAADRDGAAAPLPQRVPRAALAPLLARLAGEDVAVLDAAACAALPVSLLPVGRACQAAIYFAIKRGGACVGLLMAGHRARPEPFTPAQQRIARGVAHLAAVALAHARLLDELERANRVKSEFVATMSHELRTPLNIILGYTELLRDSGFGPLSREQDDILGRIARSGGELLELINATLDLSRLESGRLPVDLGAVQLEGLLHQIDVETRDLLRDKPPWP